MVSVFVYEHLTGGGLLEEHSPPERSLLDEGAAMVRAVATDLAGLDYVATRVLWDRRNCGEIAGGWDTVFVEDADRRDAEFDRLSGECDWTLLIAPETAGTLLRVARRVEANGGRLLGPNPALIELAGDKHSAAEFLRAAEVPAPAGLALEAGETAPTDLLWLGVLKPRLGAGSVGVRLLQPKESFAVEVPSRLEHHSPGLAASVAALCGPAGNRLLPPCRQHLSDDGFFRYLGGSLPLHADLSRRARHLAERALRAICDVPDLSPRGYLGFDLVLGHSSDGADDRVIEINPRLTTSYVALSQACRGNLAGAMLDVARGMPSRLEFDNAPLKFDNRG